MANEDTTPDGGGAPPDDVVHWVEHRSPGDTACGLQAAEVLHRVMRDDHVTCVPCIAVMTDPDRPGVSAE